MIRKVLFVLWMLSLESDHLQRAGAAVETSCAGLSTLLKSNWLLEAVLRKPHVYGACEKWL